MNAIVLTGNLVAKPEKVKYGDGKVLANFRMANNELVGGESVPNGFFDVTVFGEQAKHVVKSLDKGERVIVTGRINHQTYDREDGSKGARTKIVASEVAMSLVFGRADRRE